MELSLPNQKEAKERDLMIKIDEFIKHLRYKQSSKHTIKAYKIALNNLESFCNDNEFKEIDMEVLLDYFDYLLEHYENQRTINYKITLINRYFTWCNQKELQLKRISIQDDFYRPSINKKQYRRLLKTNDDPELDAFMLIAGHSALRIDGIMSLTRKDLYADMMKIYTKKKVIEFSLSMKILKKLRKQFKHLNNDDKLFPKSKDAMRKKLKALAVKARVTKELVYPHTFRHYFAKEYINNGGDITRLMQLMGHSDIRTTQRYTKMSKDERKKEFRQIDNT